MNRKQIVAMIAGLTVAAAAVLPTTAGADRWLTRYSSSIPACDDASALATISSRFAAKEARFWSSRLILSDFTAVREIAYMPWGDGIIPRRYCQAKVRVSDGQKARDTVVYYSIGSNTGLAGMLAGVEWCVVGYDRNLAYSPGCRMARP